ADPSELRERAAALRDGEARTAAFVTDTPGADLVRLASEQDAELLVCGPLEPTELERLLNGATCDVALAPRPELPFEPSAPKLDGTRAELVARTTAPLLLVHGGLRPGGLAPEQTLTRFSWSLAG